MKHPLQEMMDKRRQGIEPLRARTRRDVQNLPLLRRRAREPRGRAEDLRQREPFGTARVHRRDVQQRSRAFEALRVP